MFASIWMIHKIWRTDNILCLYSSQMTLWGNHISGTIFFNVLEFKISRQNMSSCNWICCKVVCIDFDTNICIWTLMNKNVQIIKKRCSGIRTGTEQSPEKRLCPTPLVTDEFRNRSARCFLTPWNTLGLA